MRKGGAEAQAAETQPPGGLIPLKVCGVDPAEVPKAPPHHAIKHVESQLMGARGIAAHAVHHAGEGATSPEKTKSDLRVFQLPNGIKEVTSCGSTLCGVRLDKSVVPNSSAQKLKVPRNFAGAIGPAEQGVGKGRGQSRHSMLMEHNHLALSQVEV